MENKLKTVDAETLLSTPMSKTMFIVDNLIPQGVNVISGASKIGKSWLMLWLGLQVAQGLPVWGLTTQQCDVLYLSLEDTQRRIKDRLRRMRFHDLRHSCASLLLANGVPLKHIQEWLGHSDFTTTANIYAHLDYSSKITSALAMETGLALPESGDFTSRWGG